jgi:histidinol dehydrogenase
VTRGAQAIAALAYGLPSDSGSGSGTGTGIGADTDSLERVDLITGPGNMFVAEAKRQLQGSVGIDSVAGPTEVLVLADASADPVHVAADLISQAEHDEAAAAVLVTPSAALAEAVRAEVDRRLAATRNRERAGAALHGQQSYILVVDDLDSAIDFANGYGAEHLEVITEHPREVAGRIRNAGAVFVGTWSPVSLGDYVAGSNHVLPTGGTCRHAAGLSVHTFLRPMQFIEYGEQDLRAVSAHVSAFAEAESLWAHGEAVAARFEAPAETWSETSSEAPYKPQP